ncbi:substrate-binding periplasmic protein [Burkholderiaceae bacterium UC74_6]
MISRHGWTKQARRGLLALALLSLLQWAVGVDAVAAQPVCSRALQVPVAALGLSITVRGSEVDGIYPRLLRALAEGCSIEYAVVPRARQQVMFELGKADLLLPASRTPERDSYAIFVPMVANRAVLISANPARAPIRNLAELLDRRDLTVVVVRGFDFGPTYQQIVDTLSAQGRLRQATDVQSVARMLEQGMADATLMSSSTLLGATLGETRYANLIAQLRYEALPELPWGESGIYVSTVSGLSAAERRYIVDKLEAIARSGQVWREFERRYPPGSISASIRPLSAKTENKAEGKTDSKTEESGNAQR